MSEAVRRRLEALLAESSPAAAPGAAPGAAPDVEPALAAPPPSPEQSTQRFLASRARRVVQFGRDHLVVVIVFLALAGAWTVHNLLQARTTAIAPVVSPVVAETGPTPTPTPVAKVLVHVLGAVARPGLVELPEGSRVADAIAAAGGLKARADPGELNLAALLPDGSQLVIGTSGHPRGEVRGAASAPLTGDGLAVISLNTATADQLDTLPGIGPVTAQRIIEWRQQHGRFTTVADLKQVDGIGPKTYADIAARVRP